VFGAYNFAGKWDAMDETRLRNILADELAKAEGLPPNAAEHLDRIRGTGPLTAGLSAAIQAMRRAVMEDKGGLVRITHQRRREEFREKERTATSR
jgi:hypothetical protein